MNDVTRPSSHRPPPLLAPHHVALRGAEILYRYAWQNTAQKSTLWPSLTSTFGRNVRCAQGLAHGHYLRGFFRRNHHPRAHTYRRRRHRTTTQVCWGQKSQVGRLGPPCTMYGTFRASYRITSGFCCGNPTPKAPNVNKTVSGIVRGVRRILHELRTKSPYWTRQST